MFRSPILIATLVLSSAVFGQQTVEKNATEPNDKLRKDAVVFLRETLTDVNGMRSLENRISFAAELAGLMWFYDEREARAMYTGVIGDFKDLIGKYDSQMNELGVTLKDEEGGSRFPSFLTEPTDGSRLLRKFTTAMGVRQQIALSIAEHDADLAFTFYNDSLLAIANPELRAQASDRDDHFVFQLLGELAETDPGKAVHYGIRTGNSGVNFQHLELLKKIYAKDADKGAEYGSALIGRLRKDKSDNRDLYIFGSLIDFGDEKLAESRKPSGRRPVFSQSELRDLAELLAQAVLSRTEENAGSAISYAATVEKYLPGRAAQIRAKFRSARPSNANMVANAISGIANVASSAVNTNASSNFNAMAYEEAVEKGVQEEKKLFEDMGKLDKKELPKEEREKIVAQSRKIIMQAQGRDKKVVALGMLAASVSKAGDRELAAEIMRDAERLVNPAPKTYQDFLLSWMLASGYAEADPEKAFPLLEETIGRANDTLAAFIKVGEFIDVAEEMIADGEVQVGGFGGAMVRGLTRELGMADATIQVLSKADFGKTKALTNRFERPEIRVLAKMMVLRAVLNPKKAPTPGALVEADPPDGDVDK